MIRFTLHANTVDQSLRVAGPIGRSSRRESTNGTPARAPAPAIPSRAAVFTKKVGEIFGDSAEPWDANNMRDRLARAGHGAPTPSGSFVACGSAGRVPTAPRGCLTEG
jgi:hypothetical protein